MKNSIREIREEKGLSREKFLDEISKKGGKETVDSTLRRMENDKNLKIFSRLREYADVLQVGISDLIETDEMMNQLYESLEEEERQYFRKYKERYNVFYPRIETKDLQYFRIRTLAEFLIYLPLFPANDLCDFLYRVMGRIDSYEHYVLEKIQYLYNQIPESDAKLYADYLYSRVQRGHQKKVIEDDFEYELENYKKYDEEKLEKGREDYAELIMLKLELVRKVKEIERIIYNTCTISTTQ